MTIQINTEAKELMEQGWHARENLEFAKAEKLLTKAKALFEQAEDWFNVTECLNHLAYTQKLKAAQTTNAGLKFVEDALAIAKTKNTKDILIKRALVSLLDTVGEFEQALNDAQQLLENTTKPANKADILTHIAYFELRTGKLEKAHKTITAALTLIIEGWHTEKDPIRSVWKTRILLTQGLILYNKNKLTEAHASATEALQIAKAQDLKTRITQANDLIKLINSTATRDTTSAQK